MNIETQTTSAIIGRLAQLVEQRPYKARVGGSSPSTPTNIVQFVMKV
jgi:hypothetical protein